MAVFSFLFGNSASSNRSLPSSTSPSYPPNSTSSSHFRSTVDGEYDDVALGGPSTSSANLAPSRPSFSAPTATDGSFVGSSASFPSASRGYDPESSYPPLPSFSRPTSSYAPASASAGAGSAAGRYPPISQTFSRLHTLLDQQSPLLLDSLSPPPPYGARDEALLSLQVAIAPYRLPPAVIESYLVHDGQDSLSLACGGGGGGGKGSTGLFYGLWWLPLERVEEEWKFWRKLEQAGGLVGSGVGGDAFSASVSSAGVGGSRKVAGRAHPYAPEGGNSRDGELGGRHEDKDLEGMSAFPRGWVRARYSHPGWLPLLSDRCGNYIGVDLDPPPPSSSPSSSPSTPAAIGPAGAYGQPGQVIAFGREIDEKVVLFPGDGPGGWARFLAAFVEDVERGEFARLGERPGSDGWSSGTGAADALSDEENGGLRGREASESGHEEGVGRGVAWTDGDGLGERGYFEEGVYGEEVVDPTTLGGSAREAQTWVLRSTYRRLAAQLSIEDSVGIIGLLCERSRRKWRSLGVGTRSASNGSSLNGRNPLSVSVPNGHVSPIAEQDEPKSQSTTRASSVSHDREQQDGNQTPNGGPSSSTLVSPSTPPTSPPSHPLAPTEADEAAANASNVELVLSPPSPTAAFHNPPLPRPRSAASNPRSSHESARSRTSTSSDPQGFLQQPPWGKGLRQPRRAPPPPAPLALPTFSELDFSEAIQGGSGAQTAGYGGRPAVPIPTATWLLNDGAAADRSSTSPSGLMSRLSFGSSPTPTREELLPTSRSSSFTEGHGFPSPSKSTIPIPMESPAHSSIPVRSREPTEEATEEHPLSLSTSPRIGSSGGGSQSTTALVSSSPPESPQDSVQIIVEGGEGELGAMRLGMAIEIGRDGRASPADEPYRS
ncbi:hypothetical protein JCM11641_004173 [Rhodosporidiobolus odoratus]